MIKIFTLIAGLLFLLLTSCDKTLLYDEVPNDPVSNFDYLWNDFDLLYGQFIVRNINWDSLYGIYRPQVHESMSDEEFYQVVTGLLSHLNDNHVSLYPTTPDLNEYNSGILGSLNECNDFKLSVVKNNYLDEFIEYSDEIAYGKFPGNIGYIHFHAFNKSIGYWSKAMDKILDYLKDTKGTIVDIRIHSGGDDRISKYIAGRFATSKRLFMTIRLRNGSEHDNFTTPLKMYVEPEKGYRYTKPLVLLTDRFSVSAAETFTLAMHTLDSITQIGDTTSGAFSDMILRELPNGWGYSVSIGEWKDKDNRSWEGIGIAPDILVKNDSADIANGIDRALERSIDLLN
jgi:carboxyl-terminal processing protease